MSGMQDDQMRQNRGRCTCGMHVGRGRQPLRGRPIGRARAGHQKSGASKEWGIKGWRVCSTGWVLPGIHDPWGHTWGHTKRGQLGCRACVDWWRGSVTGGARALGSGLLSAVGLSPQRRATGQRVAGRQGPSRAAGRCCEEGVRRAQPTVMRLASSFFCSRLGTLSASTPFCEGGVGWAGEGPKVSSRAL